MVAPTYICPFCRRNVWLMELEHTEEGKKPTGRLKCKKCGLIKEGMTVTEEKNAV